MVATEVFPRPGTTKQEVAFAGAGPHIPENELDIVTHTVSKKLRNAEEVTTAVKGYRRSDVRKRYRKGLLKGKQIRAKKY